MATADPGSGPDSSVGVSDKLQSKVNSFREVIERKKLEVRRVSRELRSLIEKKEEEIIRELDNIFWEEVNAKMVKKKTETQKEIEDIEAHELEMKKKFKKLNPISKTKIKISDPIDLVKRETDIDIPNVKLTWRLDELKDCINKMCRCDQQILVYNEDTRCQLKWSKEAVGGGKKELNLPWGIATNPLNENIYVAENGNHRVQIFSREGEWIRSVEDVEMENPKYILFQNQSIYVLCIRAILRFNESTEKKKVSKSYDFPLGGMCTDNIHIYVGLWIGMNLMVLTLDLIIEKGISLKSEFCKQDTQINDIALSQDLFYVLLFFTDTPIQAFSKEGILTRCIVKKDNLNNGRCFCIDPQHNILVVDNSDDKLKIFSNEGKLLTQFGDHKSEEGQFSYLFGISVDEFGNILTVDWKPSPKLQSFAIVN